jgi:hypothetical protein
MSSSSSESRPIQVWMDVLDRIEQSLQESLVRTTAPAPLPPPGPGSAATALEVFDERLSRWQERLEQTSSEAGQSEAEVAAEETALGELLGRIGPIREKLANLGQRPG